MEKREAAEWGWGWELRRRKGRGRDARVLTPRMRWGLWGRDLQRA